MADGASRLSENEYVAQDPGRAVEELTHALQDKSEDAEYYCQRAYAHILLQNYSDALLDAQKALQLEPSSTAFLRKGMAEYHLQNYTSALETFTEGLQLQGSGDAFNTWLTRCQDNLSASQRTEATAEEQRPTPNIKHDWYQTEAQVVITIMVKNVDKNDVSVEFSETEFSALVRLPTGEDYSLKRVLLHNIVPEQSTFKVLSTKIEIKLKKKEALRWETLEGKGETTLQHFTPDRALKYPSSSHHTKNWDQLVVELKEEEKTEKLEGDAALNQLFQQIYSHGTEEVKRAMNKSFMESGGTVLSTNWSDVGKRKVEVHPPDDLEWKKF